MNNIKFRVWDKEENKMISGDSFAFEEYVPLNDLFHNNSKQFIFMQYTGAYDIYGKDIYEGDIIRSDRGRNIYIGVVTWFETGWYIYTELTSIKKDGTKHKYYDYISLKPRYSNCVNKVLGNKFENPELLEVK